MISTRPTLRRSLNLLKSRPRIEIQHQVFRQRNQPASTTTNSTFSRTKSWIYGTSGLLVVSLGYLYLTDTRASIHRYVVPPLVRWLYPDAEEAHRVGVATMKELYSL